MKINNIVGNFQLNKPICIDVAFDILSLAKESEIVILKLKNEKTIKKENYLKHNVEKNAFNNSLQIILKCKISFKFFKNGRIHASGFQNVKTAFEKLSFILDILKINIPKEPVLVDAHEHKSGVLFYTNDNNSTFILGRSDNETYYKHKVRVFMCVKTYKTIRKHDKTMQLELCDPEDDCKQVIFDQTKNMFYGDTHLKSRYIFDNHLNFIGTSRLQFIDGYRRNLPRFDKFYIENDKLYFKSNKKKDEIPFALLVETLYKDFYKKHDRDIYLEYPCFDFEILKFETDLLNIKECIGESPSIKNPIDKTLFYNCLLNYHSIIDVKYNPNNYSGIRFEFLETKTKGQLHGNRVNLSCKYDYEAIKVFDFLKDFYKKHFNEFTKQFNVYEKFEELSIFDVFDEIV